MEEFEFVGSDPKIIESPHTKEVLAILRAQLELLKLLAAPTLYIVGEKNKVQPS